MTTAAMSPTDTRRQGKAVLHQLHAVGLDAFNCKKKRGRNVFEVDFKVPDVDDFHAPGIDPADVWAQRIMSRFKNAKVTFTHDTVATWRPHQPVIAASVIIDTGNQPLLEVRNGSNPMTEQPEDVVEADVTDITVHKPQISIMPSANESADAAVNRAIATYNAINRLVDEIFVDGVDYAALPGMKKKSLRLPGAEKVMTVLALRPEFRDLHVERNFDAQTPFLYYEVECKLVSIKTGDVMAIGQAICHSRESAFQRTAARNCPSCGAAAIQRSKYAPKGAPADAQRGWYCSTKQGGCNTQFHFDDPEISQQDTDNVNDPQLIFDSFNNIRKKANKRAQASAINAIAMLSGRFGDELDDKPDDKRTPPQRQSPPPQRQPAPPPNGHESDSKGKAKSKGWAASKALQKEIEDMLGKLDKHAVIRKLVPGQSEHWQSFSEYAEVEGNWAKAKARIEAVIVELSPPAQPKQSREEPRERPPDPARNDLMRHPREPISRQNSKISIDDLFTVDANVDKMLPPGGMTRTELYDLLDKQTGEFSNYPTLMRALSALIVSQNLPVVCTRVVYKAITDKDGKETRFGTFELPAFDLSFKLYGLRGKLKDWCGDAWYESVGVEAWEPGQDFNGKSYEIPPVVVHWEDKQVGDSTFHHKLVTHLEPVIAGAVEIH